MHGILGTALLEPSFFSGPITAMTQSNFVDLAIGHSTRAIEG